MTITILLMDKGDMVKRFLSQPLFRPFSRLTFISYLILPLVIGAGYYATNTQMFVNYTVATIRMVSNVALCYLAAYILYIFFEAPIANVKKLIYRRLSSKPQRATQYTVNQKMTGNQVKRVDHDLVEDFDMIIKSAKTKQD